VRLRPAREISGDIYAVFEDNNGRTLIAFGDVSGKGAAAALYGGLVSGLLRTLAPRRRSPAQLLMAVNEALIERKVEARYVTLCVLLWDPATRQIVMANAGATPPMICRNGEILNVRVEGVPLGLLETREYEETAYQAEPGDVIVLYSDGITDHVSTAGAEYGRGRLSLIVRSHCHVPAMELIGAIYKDLDNFNTKAFDDQTIFVMQIR
jgi:sigma-B regulation protein RsbU (phosphoserine phosphatase)